MLNISEIKSLIEALDQSSLDEFVYEVEGDKLKLKKHAPRQSSPVSTVQAPEFPPVVKETVQFEKTTEEAVNESSPSNYDHEIVSPMVGTFYLTPSPDIEPFVSVGDSVSPKSPVCIIEAMKLFNEIEAEVDGVIVEILAENGELVEYGQPLFGVKKN